MIAEERLKKVADRVMATAKGAEATVSVSASRTGNSRFAVNEITSSGDVERVGVSVTIQYGQRSASASTNQLDDHSLDELVGRAMRMAKLAPENPEAMPPLGKQTYARVNGAIDPATAQLSPEARAKSVGAALAAAGPTTLAGFYEHGDTLAMLATSAGLRAQHRWTSCSLSCTARTADGTGSGWAGAASNRAGDLDAAALAKIAVGKATSSAKPRRLEPGRYTVVLEPAAVGALLSFLTGAFGARRADEGRSFFSKKKLGDKLFPDTITLRTVPLDPQLTVVPYDGAGLPRAPAVWIDKGAIAQLHYDRFWGKKQGKPATASPDGWQLDGGTATREALIKGVKRGVLVTRFWYLRWVDPQTILATGLTRDGVFWIEDGAIAHPVNNFRFNESPIQMLARCDGLTPGTVTGEGGGMRVPALRSHEFNLASISEAV